MQKPTIEQDTADRLAIHNYSKEWQSKQQKKIEVKIKKRIKSENN